MYTFREFQGIIAIEIEKLKFNSEPRELYEPIEYILSHGGKRLRPIITLMCCELFDGDLKDAIFPALGMELFHNFTLVHDDIMDNAPVRRGEPTIHEKWDENRAILSGDAMIILANQLMMKTDVAILKEVMDIYNSSGLLVCDGQQYDLNYENKNNITMANYLKMIELKTAALLSSCCRLGAVTAKTTNENKDLIEGFGHNLGISFQIEDDILDVYGDFAKFGKSIGGDILANKKTYLLVKSLIIADETIKEELINWFSKNNVEPKGKIDAVIKIYNELDIKTHARLASKKYYDLAVGFLDKIDFEREKKENLYELADYLINRDQ